MKIKVSEQNLGVSDDLYKAGIDECGTDVIGHVFFVGLELRDGRRFNHKTSFLSYEADYTEDGERFYSSIFEEAKASAERLLARMLAKGEVDLECGFWNETYPVYGSAAYSNEEAIAWEQERGVGYDPANYGGIYG